MADTPKRESPLAARIRPGAARCEWSNRSLAMRERPFLAHIDLRGSSADAGFLSAATQALGFALPLEANTFCDQGPVRALWMGPTEWLLIVPGEEEEALAGRLRVALEGRSAAVTAVGSGQTVLRLEGEGAADLLARGCPLDLHPRVFARGRCAQSRYSKTAILLACEQPGTAFELVVRRSFAEHLWDALVDAATLIDGAGAPSSAAGGSEKQRRGALSEI